MTYPEVSEITRVRLAPGVPCPHCGHKTRGYKAPKVRKPRKITMRDLQGSGGPFARGCANMVRSDGEWRRDVVSPYLAATGKAQVPAHDPAFGRLAA